MSPLVTAYLLLAGAIISEVTGSTFLVKSDGFTKLFPSLMVVILFSFSFFLLSHVIKVLPIGIVYAIWSGVGIVLTALIGFLLFKQTIDGAGMFGMSFIVMGVIIINLFSKSVGH